MGININLAQLIALQKVAKNMALLQRKAVRTQQAGAYFSPLRGRGMDFDQTRAYQAGDDIRFMDWRVMARTGKAHTKLFCEERERPVFFLVDQSLSMRFGTRKTFKSVLAAEAASILAWAAVAGGDKVGGVVFHDSDSQATKPRGRKQGILPFLQQMVRINQEHPEILHTSPLEQAVANLRRICHPGGLVFLISDFASMTPATEQHLRCIAEHSQVLACFVQDPLESQAPAAGSYQLTDGQKRMHLNTQADKTKQQYSQQFNEHYQHIKTTLAKQKIGFCDLHTPEELVPALIRALATLREKRS